MVGKQPPGRGEVKTPAPGGAEALPEPVIRVDACSTYGVVTVGGCHAAVREAFEELNEKGLCFDYMRVRGFPFDQSVGEFLNLPSYAYEPKIINNASLTLNVR